MRKKPTLASKIKDHLYANVGVKFQTGDIERLSQSFGYEAETGRRRADEMVEDGLLNREKVGKLAYYWAGEEHKPYVPTYRFEVRNGLTVAVQV